MFLGYVKLVLKPPFGGLTEVVMYERRVIVEARGVLCDVRYRVFYIFGQLIRKQVAEYGLGLLASALEFIEAKLSIYLFSPFCRFVVGVRHFGL